MKRYSVKVCYEDGYTIDESPTGEWVKWEDVEAIDKYTDRLEADMELLDRSFTESEAKRHELEARIKELTQGDPAWYDASPVFAFQLLAQYKADIKVLAESVLKNHRCCLFSQNNDSGEPCLIELEESCSYQTAIGQCDEYGKCTCQACEVARRYLKCSS